MWLDELIHAYVASTPLPNLLDEVAKNPGATPVTYAPQIFLFSLFGNSVLVGRLLSLFALLGSVLVLWRILRVHGYNNAIAGVSLFVALPLVSRYAIELRPYSLLLFLSLILHYLYIKLHRTYSATLFAAYLFTSLLAVFTLPLALAIPLSHLIFALSLPLISGNPSPQSPSPKLAAPLLAIIVPVLFLVPWHTYASANWQTTIQEIGATDQLDIKILFLLAREITGAGYLGFFLLLFLALLALKAPSLQLADKIFWTSGLLVPIAFAAFVDALFGYFFAIRQVITSLAPLCVLAGTGLVAMQIQRPRRAMALGLLIVSLHAIYSFNWLSNKKEDWGAAAVEALTMTANGGCVILIPYSTVPYSTFIHADLPTRLCDIEAPPERYSRLVFIDSNYGETEPAVISLLKLAKKQFHPHAERRVGRFRILTFDRN